MAAHLKQVVVRSTVKGNLEIRSHCTPEEIRTFTFDSQFGTHACYKSLYTRRGSLEKEALKEDANVTLALVDNTRIIGFGILTCPEEHDRWAKLRPRLMMEIKTGEVCRQWRSLKVAGGIVKMMLSHPCIEEKIVYLVGYSWTWDLKGTQKTPQEYRKMIINLFEPYGFHEYQTNEPNICLKPENFLLGRVGKKVAQEDRNKFKWLRFGVYPGSLAGQAAFNRSHLPDLLQMPQF